MNKRIEGHRTAPSVGARHRTRTGVVAAAIVMALGLLGSVSGCGSGADDGSAKITVSDPRIPAPATPAVAAVYLTVHNGTSADDVLESVTTSAGGDAELHRSSMQNGSATMAPAGPTTVKHDGTLVLKPGGYHIMIMKPTEALHTGDHVKVTLHFRDSGAVTVDAPVLDPDVVVNGGHTSSDGAGHSSDHMTGD